MSDTLLVIMSYAGAKEQVHWSWPHYRASGYDIMGCCPENSTHDWPPDIEYVCNFGREGYSTPDLIERWVRIFERFALCHPVVDKYNSICVIEYDGVFLRPPPPIPDGVFTHLSGGNIAGFKARRFYHSPWAASWRAACVIAQEGWKLINEGEFEKGTPDFFLGLIIDRRPELAVYETGTFSVNGGALTDRKEQAIEALRLGAWYCHGLRTQEELRWVLEAAK